MTVIVELPEALAERLAAEAARRGVTIEDLAVETLEGRYGPPPRADDEMKAFIGCFDSGDPDWASNDTRALRGEAATRRRKLSFVGLGHSGHTDTARRSDEIIRDAFANKTARDA